MKSPVLTWRAMVWMAALAAAAGALALGLGVASGERQQVARIEPTPAPMPMARMAARDPLTDLLRSATVLAPHSYGSLTVFPVTVSVVTSFGPVLAMDEALAKGVLDIAEAGSGAVNEVLAVNRSDRYIFMMASEMIGGAKQDRTLGEDVLLAPYAKARIPVFCVEAHRWTAAPPAAKFRAMENNATLSVRRTARLKQSQSDVWGQVSREQERLAAPSATGALRSVFESADVQRRLEPYVSRLEKVPAAAPNVIGVVVARGDDIICADLFYHPDLLRRLWPKLLRSYAADAVGQPEGKRHVGVRDAERFLGDLYHARREQVSTPGAGQALRLRGGGATASALIFRRSVVHLEVFPGIELLPEPLRSEPRMDLQFRRERLGE
jgi:hypothetical protein